MNQISILFIAIDVAAARRKQLQQVRLAIEDCEMMQKKDDTKKKADTKMKADPFCTEKPSHDGTLRMPNYTGAFNEYLQKMHGTSLGDEAFTEKFHREGLDHELHHRCVLSCNTKCGLKHNVTSEPFNNVSDAKKDACRKMHTWFLTKAPAEESITSITSSQSICALLGDAVLKLVLILHDEAPTRDVGTLHNWITERSTNNFLKSRYKALYAASKLPDGLNPPTGHVNADAKSFEAWIGMAFEQAGRDLGKTAALVNAAVVDVI